MEIPRGARGADLIKNRYVAPQPLAPACSDGRSRIDLVEKVHLHVRFVASMRETQKRLQRTPQSDCDATSAEIIIARAQPAAVERLRRALRPFLRF